MQFTICSIGIDYIYPYIIYGIGDYFFAKTVSFYAGSRFSLCFSLSIVTITNTNSVILNGKTIANHLMRVCHVHQKISRKIFNGRAIKVTGKQCKNHFHVSRLLKLNKLLVFAPQSLSDSDVTVASARILISPTHFR